MKANLVDVYDNKIIDTIEDENWIKLKDKLKNYITTTLNLSCPYFYIVNNKGKARINFGNYYKFFDLDIDYVDFYKNENLNKVTTSNFPKYSMSIPELLQEFDDLLNRASIQGSKIISRSRITELRNYLKSYLHE